MQCTGLTLWTRDRRRRQVRGGEAMRGWRGKRRTSRQKWHWQSNPMHPKSFLGAVKEGPFPPRGGGTALNMAGAHVLAMLSTGDSSLNALTQGLPIRCYGQWELQGLAQHGDGIEVRGWSGSPKGHEKTVGARNAGKLHFSACEGRTSCQMRRATKCQDWSVSSPARQLQWLQPS